METLFRDVACTVCGCVCDDLRLTVRGNRIVKAEGACSLAEPWLLAQETSHPPQAAVQGQAVTLAAGIERASDILRKADSPLIYGLSRSSTQGQRAAIRLADRLGATIDTTASRCHAPSIMALQQVGESTCSLGETSNRADLVVFWGSNPVDSHPRHMERYSVDPCGQFVTGGRADRHVVVADVQHTASTGLADEFVQLEPGSDFDVIWALRGLINGVTGTSRESRMTSHAERSENGPDERRSPQGDPLADIGDECSLRSADAGMRDAVGGVPMTRLQGLAQRMKTCRSGVVFFGLGLTRHGVPHANVEALLRLVTDLNRHTRFYARRMRIPGDVAGADSVLCWQTGFPFSVNLGRGFPRFNPGEFSANEMLERGETDACLLVGSEGVAGLSPGAAENLSRIPTIVLDYPTADCPLHPTVAFTTAVYGVHLPGTAYRMDETPIPLRAVLETDYPSDADVLSGIERSHTGRAEPMSRNNDRRPTHA